MIDKTELTKLIYFHFGSKKACADALGIAQSTLSRLIKKPTANFISRLQKIGVSFTSDETKKQIKEPQTSYSSNNETCQIIEKQEKIINILVDKIKSLEKEKYSLLDQISQINEANKKASTKNYKLKHKR